MNQNDSKAFVEFARPYYAQKDSAHDFRHIERIFARLEELAEGLRPAPRPHWLYFLAAFHGLVPRIRDDTAFQEKVRTFLQGLGLDDREVEEMFDAVLRHLEEPRTTEEQIVRDANYVEMLGALGIAKAFTTGGARGQSYEETADIFESRFLDRIEFLTPTGQRLAKERRAYGKDFLRRLRSEW